jgi:hypothetical protein
MGMTGSLTLGTTAADGLLLSRSTGMATWSHVRFPAVWDGWIHVLFAGGESMYSVLEAWLVLLLSVTPDPSASLV